MSNTKPENTNHCVLLHGPEKSSISTIPVPNLKDFPPDHVLLAVAYTGVCGSDVHFYTHGGVGSDHRKYAQYYTSQTFPSDLATSSGSGLPTSTSGLVMGHEATATVLSTNSSVRSLHSGDKVAIEPGTPCRTCVRCSSGHYNLCTGMRFAASFYESDTLTADSDGGEIPLVLSTPGTLQKYYVLPESLCYKLPAHIDLQAGVLVEPLAVAVHAVRLAQINPQTKSVLITGAGTIGLVMAAVSCAYGAGKLVLVDIDDKKLKFAKQWLTSPKGAAAKAGVAVFTINSASKAVTSNSNSSSSATNDLVRRINEGFGLGDGAHVALEASGSPAAIKLCIATLRTDGHMVQTGLSKNPNMDAFPICDLSEKEIHVHGAFRYKQGDFETARDLLGRGVVGDVSGLISKVWGFEEYEMAWKATRDGDGNGVKNLIRCPGINVDVSTT